MTCIHIIYIYSCQRCDGQFLIAVGSSLKFQIFWSIHLWSWSKEPPPPRPGGFSLWVASKWGARAGKKPGRRRSSSWLFIWKRVCFVLLILNATMFSTLPMQQERLPSGKLTYLFLEFDSPAIPSYHRQPSSLEWGKEASHSFNKSARGLSLREANV